MKLPPITAKQYVVLQLLRSGQELAGRELRAELAKADLRTSTVAFYNLMKRLVVGGFVSRSTRVELVGGHEVRQTYYRTTPLGAHALVETFAFYTSFPSPGLDFS